MGLSELWKHNREQLVDKAVHQIIAFAGNGKLGDDSRASGEWREYLEQIPTDMVIGYARECLESFTDSGLALQDLVNQLGRRLGCVVEYGRYRGQQGASGHDGLWRLHNEHEIVVEVKTTDTFRISLETLMGYRATLGRDKRVQADRATVLIVVGREDTGAFEAQIRGSRFAWEVRLISVEALIRLVKLKESVNDPRTIQQIHNILIPREYTRLDGLIDFVFTTTEDVVPVSIEETPDKPGPKFTPVNFHAACKARLERHLNQPLQNITRSLFQSVDNKLRLYCTISKNHEAAGDESYWFAFHSYTPDALKQAPTAMVAFGCGSEAQMFLLPLEEVERWLPLLNATIRDGVHYSHVVLYREGMQWWLKCRAGNKPISMNQFLLTTD